MSEPAAVDAVSYSEQMAEALRAACPKGDFIPSVVVARFVRRLRQRDPRLLMGWLDERAESIILTELDGLLRRDRAVARARSGARAFASAADAAAVGDLGPMRLLMDTRYVVDDQQTRRRLGDMTGADHTFVADGYRSRANRQLMLESFHRVLARKVGRRRTEEVFTDDQLAELQAKILGESA